MFLSHYSYYWRLLNAVGLLVAVLMLGSALYLQLVEFIMPCQICIYIRVLIILYGIVSLLALLHQPALRGKSVYTRIFIFFSVLGIMASSYLLWLQKGAAAEFYSCSQSGNILFIDGPLGEMLALLFSSYTGCDELHWNWFGLTLPLGALLGFIVLLGLDMLKYRRQKPNS